jgi:ubiquinone/menaquinone biosynthesis C-methylase UbiE
LGPGLLLSAIADIVGATGAVHGIDISEPLNAFARAHCRHQHWVEIDHGSATRLPYADDAFDRVLSTQVMEYVEDVDSAIRELYRVIKPGGQVVIVDTDWDSIVWHSDDVGRMNDVLTAWAQHAPHPHLPRTLAGRLHRAGFVITGRRVLPLFNPSFDENTYSNRMIDLIAAYVARLAGKQISQPEEWARNLRDIGTRGDYFFSINRYLFAASKPTEE